MRLSLRSMVTLATGVPIAISFVAVAVMVLPLWQEYRHANKLIRFDSRLGTAISALARERGITAAILSDPGHASAAEAGEIMRLRSEIDPAIEEVLHGLGQDPAATGLLARLGKARIAYAGIQDIRKEVDDLLSAGGETQRAARESTQEATLSGDAWIAAMTELIEAWQNVRLALLRNAGSSDTTFQDLQMLSYFAWSVAEHAGRERAMIGMLIASGSAIDFASNERLQHNRGETQFAWQMASLLADAVSAEPGLPETARAASNGYFIQFEELRRSVIAAGLAGQAYPVDSAAWFAAASHAIDGFRSLEVRAGLATARLRDEAFWRTLNIIVLVALLGVFVVISAIGAIYLVKRRIFDPVRLMTHATRSFARGDYTAAIPKAVGHNEIEDMTAAVGEMRDNAIARAQLEAELRCARDLAETANRAKSQFLANIGHELRTPLNAVIGFSELILRESVNGSRYREYARDINESGHHLLEIINDILDMSRIDIGAMNLERRETDLAELLVHCARCYADKARQKEQHLVLDIDPLPMLELDQNRVVQMVKNLLSNAIKFTPKGGTVRLRCGVALGFAYIEVSDTGAGMASTDIVRALEAFSQLDAGLERRYEGTGLGLPIARAIAELHNGRLEVHSELGRGTTVRVSLPIREGADTRPINLRNSCALS
ncbi:ATP-binding protein [Dongia sp.]|uniref:ATP-binding protein n=1 Tax=Dongia sp. TaxID=1977262 RepID=UPI0035B4E00F